MTNPSHTDTSRSGDLVARLEEWALTLLAACDGGDLGTDEPAALMYQALDRIEALEAEIERLRGALEHIGIYGCGMLNQPAALNAPEEVWLKQRIFEMERTARAALGDSHD